MLVVPIGVSLCAVAVDVAALRRRRAEAGQRKLAERRRRAWGEE